jgi:lipoprotein signal peptidase
VADACITVGVFIILIFQKKFFKEEVPIVKTSEASSTEEIQSA